MIAYSIDAFMDIRCPWHSFNFIYLELGAGTNLDGNFPFQLRLQLKKSEMWTCPTTAHFFSLPQSTSDEHEFGELNDIFQCC